MSEGSYFRDWSFSNQDPALGSEWSERLASLPDFSLTLDGVFNPKPPDVQIVTEFKRSRWPFARLLVAVEVNGRVVWAQRKTIFLARTVVELMRDGHAIASAIQARPTGIVWKRWADDD